MQLRVQGNATNATATSMEHRFSIESKLEKHKVDDAVTVDRKPANNNDIQRSEEEDNNW